MQLNYDIDILPTAEGPSSVGQSAPAQVHYAAFRDPATAQAARRASPRTMAILSEAGIALDSYSSGAPEGHYPLGDGDAREYLMACMVGAITAEPDEGEDVAEGEFDLSQCLVAMSAARPFGALVPFGYAAMTAPEKPKPTVYLAISVLAVAGYMAGFAVFS